MQKYSHMKTKAGFTLLRLRKNPDKDICFYGFTLLTATQEKLYDSLVLILSQCCSRDKYPFLCVHNNLLPSKKPPYLQISTLKDVFVSLRFYVFLCGVV